MHKDCDKHYFKKPEFYRLTGENNYVRIDAEDKVTGHGQYVGDIMFPDMLTGKMVRSPYASAKILSIDTSEAEKLPGVKCILTARDFGSPWWEMENLQLSSRTRKYCVLRRCARLVTMWQPWQPWMRKPPSGPRI